MPERLRLLESRIDSESALSTNPCSPRALQTPLPLGAGCLPGGSSLSGHPPR